MTAPLPGPGQLPEQMPAFPDRLGRRLCRALVKLCGWHLVGDFPDVPKLVMIAAPHSSWWDGIWGLLIKIAVGANIHFMGKQELFVGPVGWILRRMGGMPIDRHAAKGVVEQMVDAFNDSSSLWLGIAPEGTRKKVDKWRTGFWHIARQARVPVFPIAFHYPDKAIHLGPLFELSDDMPEDLKQLRQFYTSFQGKHRNA